jgi:hypothetical protein
MSAISASGFSDSSDRSFAFVAVSIAWLQFRVVNSGFLESWALALADFVASYMSWHRVNKFRVVEQPSDFLADVAAEFARRSLNFSDNRWATVKDCYDVLEVTAGVEVSFPSSAECLQFCPDEVRRGHDPQLKPVERDDCGSFNSGLYQRFENPRIVSSVGMTSSFIWSISHRQIGAPSDESSEKPRLRRRLEKRAYSA